MMRVLFIALLLLGGCATTAPVEEDPALAEAQSQELAAQLLQHGDDAAREGKLNDALAMYAGSIAEVPTAACWMRVGAISNRLGEPDQAASAFAKALELEPDNASAYEELGLIYLTADRREAARAQLSKSLELDPARWRAANGLGVLADLEKDYEAAIGHYRAALAIEPHSAMILNNLGYSHYLSGDLESARQLYMESLSMDTGYVPARYNLGLLYARQGAYDDALTILASAMEPAEAYNDVGFIALKNADYLNAEKLLEEAIRLSPTHMESANRNLEVAQEKLRELESG